MEDSVNNILQKRSKEFPISFEITPPYRGEGIQTVMTIVDELSNFNPMFIDVTSHCSHCINCYDSQDSLDMKAKRKRPGTLPICMLIQERYGITSVPHILCKGFTKEETEDLLIDLNYANIDNVMALTGDDPGYDKSYSGKRINRNAVDLIRQIKDMNEGIFLDNHKHMKETKFHIGVAGYPEKHNEEDIKYLKEKIDAGGEYIITQMFFNNDDYFRYLDLCKDNGITIPIIPGLKLLTSKKQLGALHDIFHINIPEEFNKINDEDFLDFSVRWTMNQTLELLHNNIPSVHYFVTQNIAPVKLMINQIYEYI